MKKLFFTLDNRAEKRRLEFEPTVKLASNSEKTEGRNSDLQTNDHTFPRNTRHGQKGSQADNGRNWQPLVSAH